MKQELTSKFLLSRCVESDKLETNFKINFHRLSLKEYNKKYTKNFIYYQFYDTIYGNVLVANTDKGLCYLHFVENKEKALLDFKNLFTDCNLLQQNTTMHTEAINILSKEIWPDLLSLHLLGTDFQYKVWRGLVKIKKGDITTYSNLAKNLAIEKASRAVGSAIGSNNIAYIVPCHRVIQKTGKYTGFRWGNTLKKIFLENELSTKN